MGLANYARARKDPNVPQDNITALPLPSGPRTMMLLGNDPDKNTFHWEGPFGLPFETAPGQLYGWLKGWTRRDGFSDVLLAPESREDVPRLYLLDPRVENWRAVAWDDRVFIVQDRTTGRDKMVVERNFLFTRRLNPSGSFESLEMRTSPYAVAAFERGGVNSFLKLERVDRQV
jgi:hypothetical protein